MSTPLISRDLRTRIVAHYTQTEHATYKSTAERFGVGEATVNRTLRVHRETGDVMPTPRPKKPKHKIDLEWLRQHAQAYPDARLKDRAAAFEAERGITVSLAAVCYAMVVIGFTYKKNDLRNRTRHRASPKAARRLRRAATQSECRATHLCR